MREQFSPTGTLCGGQAELPGKSRPDEGAKTAPGGGRGLRTGCAQQGNGGHRVLDVVKYHTGHPPGQRAYPGTKTVSGGEPGTVHRLRHGGTAGNGGVWCREGTALGTRRGRGHARAQKQPRARLGAVRRLRPRESGRRRGYLVPGSITLDTHRGREHARAQKQPPAGAGGCLDAGYGCYLPRAIRVIWMHRVGSTARPRIMPS